MRWGPRTRSVAGAVVVASSWYGARQRSIGAGVRVAVTTFAAAAISYVGIELWRSRDRLRRAAELIDVPRRPGRDRYERRSRTVERLVDRAWEGHADRVVPVLQERFATPSRSRAQRIDAGLALADWWITHGRASSSLEVLASIRELLGDDDVPTIAWSLELEARMLSGTTGPVLPPEVKERLGRHEHLRYFLANLGGPHERLGVLNQCYRESGLAQVRFGPAEDLEHLVGAEVPTRRGGPLVTVIVPMYRAETTVGIALRSLRSQTWTDLEILVVDDASDDASVDVVRSIAEGDERIRLLRQPTNQGAYAARNRGLAAAQGEFVIVNDADDWSHPEKIERQVAAFRGDPATAATMSSLARVTRDVRFVRRGLPPSDVVGMNYSSLMVRRAVLERIGPWDAVRVEGDSELLGRLRAAEGRRCVAMVDKGVPLSLALRDLASLSASSRTGLGTHKHAQGARRAYRDAYLEWHASTSFTSDLPLVRSDDRHPFVRPRVLDPESEPRSRVDVLLMSDLGLPGGTTSSNLAEIAANERLGLRTGLLHNRNPRFPDEGVNPKFRAAASVATHLITLGESVETDVLVIKYPPCVSEIPAPFPDVTVHGEAVIVVNQTPWTGYTGSDRRKVYDLVACDAEVRRTFGVDPLWMPIGPTVRDVLATHHRDEWASVRCSDRDWVELIDVERWWAPRRVRSDDTITIGRHGRDSIWKWPATGERIRTVYPEDPRFRVEILGGADVAVELLGGLPQNWHVHEFDSIEPVDYLRRLDAFVYFPHPDMVEAFGRTILEALAAGVPVVTDRRFASVFGDVVICCEPDDAAGAVVDLCADDAYYDEIRRRGRRFVEERFGLAAHLERLRASGLGQVS